MRRLYERWIKRGREGGEKLQDAGGLEDRNQAGDKEVKEERQDESGSGGRGRNQDEDTQARGIKECEGKEDAREYTRNILQEWEMELAEREDFATRVEVAKAKRERERKKARGS
ncbi:hypothetical protein DL95DRAFT_451585 [Leptodontidium sp. 2 PMI_412]|nr:hypothetical protein DL95DRAFT_451585 [Leptodontidium sp. 2 PMI_412]